jgi:hypothetical protein
MGVIIVVVVVVVVCVCVFCWVASVLSWHAKVEEELVVCEILLTTTNLWDWVINDFFFYDLQIGKNSRAFFITTN